ncbi:MAG: O-antigen ligase family protein [Myxococcaceae bacterium]|nr:O-antigen ligase family protein [Myxococcaceae bacterium]
MAPSLPTRALAALGLGLWLVGVQSFEGLASTGLALAAASGLVVLARSADERTRVLRATWPVLLWLSWALVAPTLAGARPSGTGLARALDWLAVPLGAAALGATSARTRRGLVWALAGTALLSCMCAGLQHFGVWPDERAFDALAWTRQPYGRVYEEVPGEPGRFMGGGLLFHRLKFAHVTGLVALAALSLRTRWAIALAAATTLSVWLFPEARLASVALLVALAVGVVQATPRPRVALLGLTGLAVLAALAVALSPGLRERLSTSLTAEGSGERRHLLETGLRAVEAHPFAGVGPGNFQPARFADGSTPALVSENPGKAHNQLLSMAAETGIPGALLFVFSLAWLWRCSPRRALLTPVLVFFGVLGLGHDPLFQAPFSMALVLALGASLTPPSASAGTAAASPRSPGSPPPAGPASPGTAGTPT